VIASEFCLHSVQSLRFLATRLDERFLEICTVEQHRGDHIM
jgi:hypothetical protein